MYADNALQTGEHGATFLGAAGRRYQALRVRYFVFGGETAESVQVPLGRHRWQSCLQSSQDAVSGFISTLLFPLPDLEDWRLSILPSPDPVLDFLHILVLVASGPLVSWCVKESRWVC